MPLSLRQYKPFSILAVLLVVGCVIVITGSLTDDGLTGGLLSSDAQSGRAAGTQNDGDSDKLDASGRETRTSSGPVARDAASDDGIDKTPLGSVPHKALYEMTMISKHAGAQVSDIAGRMAFEWRPGCDGWLSRHRFRLNYIYPDSTGARVISRNSTLEAYDGSRMDFTTQRWRNGRLLEEYRGRAERKGEGGGYKVTYNEPAGASFAMPDKVMFPMAHTFAVLRAAREGRTFFRAPVFDGQDDDGEVLISAFIGDSINAMAHLEPSEAIDTSLVNTQAWHVRMAFFPERERMISPDYEISAHLLDNSVISRMRVAYDDFTVQQELVALEKLEVETCE